MGQSVQIVGKRLLRPGVLRFEIDRSLTSTAHEVYQNLSQASDSTPSAELALRLFQTGLVNSVHIYSNIITVELIEGSDHTRVNQLDEEVRNLFIHYLPGVMPTAV